MHFGEKHKQHNIYYGSKSIQGNKFGNKPPFKSALGINSFMPNHVSRIPETKVIRHENITLTHFKNDNNHAIHNINRGSLGDRNSLERHKRQEKIDNSSHFH